MAFLRKYSFVGPISFCMPYSSETSKPVFIRAGLAFNGLIVHKCEQFSKNKLRAIQMYSSKYVFLSSR